MKRLQIIMLGAATFIVVVIAIYTPDLLEALIEWMKSKAK